jgi:hypothetical protein
VHRLLKKSLGSRSGDSKETTENPNQTHMEKLYDRAAFERSTGDIRAVNPGEISTPGHGLNLDAEVEWYDFIAGSSRRFNAEVEEAEKNYVEATKGMAKLMNENPKVKTYWNSIPEAQQKIAAENAYKLWVPKPARKREDVVNEGVARMDGTWTQPPAKDGSLGRSDGLPSYVLTP